MSAYVLLASSDVCLGSRAREAASAERRKTADCMVKLGVCYVVLGFRCGVQYIEKIELVSSHVKDRNASSIAGSKQ